jgi:signal transduction histidine kinase
MFSTWSIKWKLMGSILLTSATVLLLTCGTFLAYDLVTFRQAMVGNLSILAHVIAANSTAALAFDNRNDASGVLSALAAEKHVVAAGLFDKTGRLFAAYPTTAAAGAVPSRPEPDGYRFTSTRLVWYGPVINANRRLGTLYLQSDLGALYARLKLYGGVTGSVVTLSCLVAFALSSRLQGYISRPVLALVRAATAVAEHRDYSLRADRFGEDELGRLTDAFNEMLARIQEQDGALRSREDSLRREMAERARAEAEIQALNATLEQRVHDRTQALEAANKELEAFSYSVSHDLRAPLRHIHGYGEMLQRATTDGQLSNEAHRYVRTIMAASADMGVLIDDLLAFSRTGRVELRASPVSLSELVDDTVRGLEMAIRDRPIVWLVASLPRVIGDPSMVRQVLANLIGNAVKYTRMRDPARIEIGCAGEEHGRAILFVRDNGAGFDPQYAHKLFGVFQRLHRAEEFEGTGIGLATVQRIVARHGGRVWAEGALDRGAAFYFTLQNALPSP